MPRHFFEVLLFLFVTIDVICHVIHCMCCHRLLNICGLSSFYCAATITSGAVVARKQQSESWTGAILVSSGVVILRVRRLHSNLHRHRPSGIVATNCGFPEYFMIHRYYLWIISFKFQLFLYSIKYSIYKFFRFINNLFV